MKKLEIGCGKRPKEGYKTMDVDPEANPDILWDATITPYPFEDNSLDEIYSHWVLEHFAHRQIDRILVEWLRILKLGGQVIAVTNNYDAHNKALWEGIINWEEWNKMIFGLTNNGQPVSVFECHKFGWNEKYATKKFKEIGFSKVKVEVGWKHREDNGLIKCPGIIITATK